MKKNLTLILTALSIFLFSCKKDTTENPAPVPAAVKKMTSTTLISPLGATFDYNADGTLKQILDKRNWATYQYEFSYQPGKVNIICRNAATNVTTETTNITLNAKGYATNSEKTVYDNIGNPINTDNTQYIYNADGLLEQAMKLGSYKSKYFYNNQQNLVKQEFYDWADNLLEYTEYQYGTTPDYFPALGPASFNWFNIFLPARSKNLITYVKATDVIQNKITWDASYTYNLDNDGYVLKCFMHDMLPGGTDWEWANTWDK